MIYLIYKEGRIKMKLSILTATYNRANFLPKLYSSIKENLKYNLNCEWIIIDDGSNDDTKAKVQNFMDENIIQIKYCYQKNSGKMSAINEAVKFASGDLIVDCDSDDYFVPDAFEKIRKYANKLLKNENLYGIIFLKSEVDGELSGKPFNSNEQETTMFDLYFKQDIKGEKIIVFNAKTQRPAVCNAAETLLVHKDIAEAFLPALAEKLKEKNVEIRGCNKTCALLKEAVPATEADWETEFLDYILAVNGTETVDINVENLETKPAKAGYYNGTFNISFPAAETDSSDSEAGESTEDDTDTSATDMLAGFGAVIKLTSDADADTSTLDLTVTTSGAALATLSITGSYGEGVEIPDFASLDKTYDATDDEAMTEYLTEINWDTFLANVKAAGVPDELATQLEDVLKAAVESASQPAEEENADTETDTDTTAEDDAA